MQINLLIKKSSIIIVLIFLFLQPLLQVSADPIQTSGTMTIDNYQGYPGDSLTIQVEGTWETEITGYHMLLKFMPGNNSINVADVNIDNCINYENAELVPLLESEEDSLIMKQVFVLFDNSIPAGSGTLLNINVDINEDITPGSVIIDLHSPDESDWCIYQGESPHPECTDGLLEILNHPPNTPESIQGETAGEIDTEYTYTVDEVIDLDGDTIIAYGWDFYGDGNVKWTSLPTTSFTWAEVGNYDIKVKARDSYLAESGWSEPLSVSITSPTSELEQLSIEVATSVSEGENVEVLITVDDSPIQGVTVNCFDKQQETDSSGKTTFDCPIVEQDSIYEVTASHNIYLSARATFIVKNFVEAISQGFAYGIVTDNNDKAISNAVICVFSGDESIQCIKTDFTGGYISTLPPGTYTSTVSKYGYLSETQAIVIVKNSASEINYNLLKEKAEESTEIPNDYIGYTIGSLIDSGDIAGTVDFGDTNSFQVYDKINIKLDDQLKNDEITFSISGTELKHATFAVKIKEGVLSDLEKVELKIDGIIIDNVGFDELINFNNDTPKWTSVLTTDMDNNEILYIICTTPLSEHTITISSIAEVFGGVTAMIMYTVLSSAALILFIGLIIIRKRM